MEVGLLAGVFNYGGPRKPGAQSGQGKTVLRRADLPRRARFGPRLAASLASFRRDGL